MSEDRRSWSGKKILITGFSGFLGSHLTLALLKSGARVIGIDKRVERKNSILKGKHLKLYSVCANIRNFRLVSDIITKHKPDFIFHLAAQAIVGKANKIPLATFKDNITGTWNILEVAKRCKIKNIIVSSSDKAYGVHSKLPYEEKSRLCGIYPYDVSKSCADLISHSYFKSFQLPVCVTRCGNIYGPGDLHFERIVPDTIISAIRGRTLLIRSDGKFTRDYIFVEDIVSGYLKLAQIMTRGRLHGQAFNFSNERPLSVLELVRKIYRLIGKRPKYRILNQASCEIKKQYLCAQKAKKVLSWRPKESLDSGLRKTIAWYEEYLKNE
ncbi:MAG: GDP-mannose 4,6-dehydratase [Candidatus Omnitrophica bacterium]|nr:GDP-mannose 4,6-dehydratase [Candidatus Omnitrophota bacterium]